MGGTMYKQKSKSSHIVGSTLIRNVAIILVIILTIVLYNFVNLSYIYLATTILGLSVGLDTILIFISEFLEYKIAGDYEKKNYYLGRNIVYKKYYDNFCLIILRAFPVRLFLWIIAIIPVILLLPKILSSASTKLFICFLTLIRDAERILGSIWGASFFVVSLLCIAVLIESIALNREVFDGKGIYSEKQKKQVKEEIKTLVNAYYSQHFKKVISPYRVYSCKKYEISIPVGDMVNTLIQESINATEKEKKEYSEYLNIVSFCEYKRLKYFASKIHANSKFIENTKKEKIISFIRKYYKEKWEHLDSLQEKLIPSINWLYMAYYDVSILQILEKEFVNDDYYLSIFWGKLERRCRYFSMNSDRKSNVILSLIIEVLQNQLERTDLFDSFNIGIETISNLFDLLHQFEITESSRTNKTFKPIVKNEYGYILFRAFYYRTIDAKQWNNTNAIKIRKYLSSNDISIYIRDMIVRASIEAIAERYWDSIDALKYLLQFIDYETLVALLLFRLADVNRAGKGTIKLDEHLIWHDALEKYTYTNTSLNKAHISRVCAFIHESYASHYMKDNYIEWICESLNSNIDDNLYTIFRNNIGYDFSFSSYAVFRLTMGEYYYFRSIPAMSKFKEVQTQLKTIEDILKHWGLGYII